MKHQDFQAFFYRIFNDKNFILKYLDDALTDFVLPSIEATIGGKSSRELICNR